MSQKHTFTTTRTKESEACPGVVFHLRKMTEGRRIQLRKTLGEANAKMRSIGRDQDAILAKPAGEQDMAKFMDLQDDADTLAIETINPMTLLWGIKAVEGLEIDGKPLSIEDWQDFPSELFNEMLTAVKLESGFTRQEEKNSQSPTTHGGPELVSQKSSTAPSAKSENTIDSEIVPNTSLN